MKLQDDLQGRASAYDKANAIQAKADAENRDMTPEEVTEFNNEVAKVEQYNAKIARRQTLEKAEASLDSNGKPEPIHSEVKRYSLLRALRLTLENRQLDGIEGEVNFELAKKSGKSPNGFYMPLDLPVNQYGLLDTTTGAGAVKTVTDDSNFIDLLRNKTTVIGLGARMMNGLVGTVRFPRQSGAGSAYWLSTDGVSAVTISNQTIDYVSLSQRSLAGYSTYTRAFLHQTGIDAENFVRNDLAAVLGIELDRVVINGSGSGQEPEGILQNSGVTTVAIGANGGAPTFSTVVGLESAVAGYNADIGSLAYLTNAAGRGKLKTTAVASNYPRFLYDMGEVNGYPCAVSNNVPSNLTKGASGTSLSALIFGNWNDVLIGMWGGLDVVVNPYTNDVYGSVRITLMQDCDVAFRHDESFAKCVDMATA